MEKKNNIICLDCGTMKENKYGLCINGHDNWLEKFDEVSRFAEACIKFNLSPQELLEQLK